MPYSATSAAATSSWVESGFDAHRSTSAPPALSVRARLAVSDVTCRQAETRRPASGFSAAKRSRIAARTRSEERRVGEECRLGWGAGGVEKEGEVSGGGGRG